MYIGPLAVCIARKLATFDEHWDSMQYNVPALPVSTHTKQEGKTAYQHLTRGQCLLHWKFPEVALRWQNV